MSDNSIFPVPAEMAENAWCNEAGYFKLYEQSIADRKVAWQPVDREILPEQARWTVLPQSIAPPAIVFAAVRVNGLVGAAVVFFVHD